MRRSIVSAALIIAGLVWSTVCHAQDQFIPAKVTGVIDGDTIVISTASYGTNIRMRLSEIDAPEIDQPFGIQAKALLTKQLLGKMITVRIDGYDKYRRRLGTIKGSGDGSYNYDLVKAGYAWHYKQYSKDARFVPAETEARLARRGLWAVGTPVAPWDWRQRKPNTPDRTPTKKVLTFADLDGKAVIVAKDGKYLGLISSNEFDPKSIINEFGTHGSEFRTNSINNKFGTYGSEFSTKSPFNEFTTTPPQVFLGNQFVGYLTKNKFKTPRIDPHALIGYLKSK